MQSKMVVSTAQGIASLQLEPHSHKRKLLDVMHANHHQWPAAHTDVKHHLEIRRTAMLGQDSM